jgi:hypothetical protein
MRSSLVFRSRLAALVCAALLGPPALAQNTGGLFIAGGGGFGFAQAARQALAKGGGAGSFVLVLPPATDALAASGASAEAVDLRKQLMAAGGSLLVCRRDVTAGAVPAAGLMPGVQIVRGWPQPGGPQLVPNTNFYPDENPASLPAATDLLQRLRSACS